MNSLIALGATTSFTAGSLSAFIPGLTVDPSFLEEPVMLLAFVLLGRSLEARARIQASGACMFCFSTATPACAIYATQ
jgi:Cu2+-exporting ATPase